MCGLVAHFARAGRGQIDEAAFAAMLRSLQHRGPDDSTVFRRDGVTLGHRRLSIIDLSGGAQPVFNETGTVACVLNGEIYNYRELRSRLEKCGHTFKTASDTEAIVHAYEEYGEKALAELTGMFAIVLVDFEKNRALVARDRLGEKPLYYIDDPAFFTCASEIRAFAFHPAAQRRIDRGALASYLQFGWVAGPSSIYESIRRLEPGHYLVIDERGVRKDRYWFPNLEPLTGVSRADLRAMLVEQLDRTIANKLIADVPLGVFLSGGLDSSTVVAMASRHHGGRLRTYSVGFGTAANELPYARLVAQRYGTDHTEIVIDSNIADSVPRVAAHFDEPFADSSSVPTYLISKAAREHVTVILTGDGGDELLAGYESYARLRFLSSNRWLGKGVALADRALEKIGGWSLADAAYPLPSSANGDDEWQRVRSTFAPAEVAGLLAGGSVPAFDARRHLWLPLAGADPLSRAFEFDLNYYLPDDLLKKVDIAAMFASLETRAPLLDHSFVELCLRIPPLEKVRHGIDKSLLREAMQPYLPAEVLTREKHGFGAPMGRWLAGDLSGMVRELTSADALVNGLLDREAVRKQVSSSMATLDRDWRASGQVWTLLMLEQWLRHHGSAAASA